MYYGPEDRPNSPRSLATRTAGGRVPLRRPPARCAPNFYLTSDVSRHELRPRR